MWQIPRKTVDLMDVENPEATPGAAQPELHFMRYDRQETGRAQVVRCQEGQYCWGLEISVVHGETVNLTQYSGQGLGKT